MGNYYKNGIIIVPNMYFDAKFLDELVKKAFYKSEGKSYPISYIEYQETSMGTNAILHFEGSDYVAKGFVSGDVDKSGRLVIALSDLEDF